MLECFYKPSNPVRSSTLRKRRPLSEPRFRPGEETWARNFDWLIIELFRSRMVYILNVNTKQNTQIERSHLDNWRLFNNNTYRLKLTYVKPYIMLSSQSDTMKRLSQNTC